jgi:hypothetical protein
MPFLCAFVSSCEIIAVPVSEVDGTDAAALNGKIFHHRDTEIAESETRGACLACDADFWAMICLKDRASL